MSFDAHSLERLRKLVCQVPQPAFGAALRASEKRPKVETEADPQAVLHEMVQVSPDATVPPHLIDRLRQVEEQQLYTEFPALLLEGEGDD